MTKDEQILAWARKVGIDIVQYRELLDIIAPRASTPVLATALPADFRLVAEMAGGALWRNNSGVLTPMPKGPNDKPRPIRFGLGNDSAALNKVMKSSDWIGIAPGGRFLAVEQKPSGWRLMPGDERGQAQLNFHERVRKLGGVAGFATEPRHILEIMNQ